jgi:phage shock protein PspC (stress-responsive transcriptional regulator)
MSSDVELVRPRRREGRVIAGVCAGVADRFGMSRALIRLIFIVFGLFGPGELVYILLWLVVPSPPSRAGTAGSPGQPVDP